MTEKNLGKADFYTSIVLVAFGIAAFVMSRQMPEVYDRGGQGPFSAPGLVPSILGIVIAALGLVLFIRSLVRTRGHVGLPGASFKNAVGDIGTFRIIATIVICLCYVFLLGKILFPLLTGVFVFAFIVFFEYDRATPFRQQIKKLLIAALVALLTSAVVSSVFRYLFLVRLP